MLSLLSGLRPDRTAHRAGLPAISEPPARQIARERRASLMLPPVIVQAKKSPRHFGMTPLWIGGGSLRDRLVMLIALELAGLSGARTKTCGAVSCGITTAPQIAVSAAPTCGEEP
jgi:hypothetical protein